MTKKKLYQNVNVKPNKNGNQNTNSVNVIINPNEDRNDDDDEMYDKKSSKNNTMMNMYNNPPQVDSNDMGQILGRAHRHDISLTKEDVNEANNNSNNDNVIGAIQENLNAEQLEDMLEEERARNEENFERVMGAISDEAILNRQREK